MVAKLVCQLKGIKNPVAFFKIRGPPASKNMFDQNMESSTLGLGFGFVACGLSAKIWQ